MSRIEGHSGKGFYDNGSSPLPLSQETYGLSAVRLHAGEGFNGNGCGRDARGPSNGYFANWPFIQQ